MKRAIAAAAAGAALCAGQQQSAVDSAGPHAARIETLWWFFFWLLLSIFVVVIALLLGALLRRHRAGTPERTPNPSGPTEKKLATTVTAATVFTVLVLLGLIVISVATGKAISNPGGASKDAMVVEVVGNQWWWYVRYLNDDASRIVVTANEMHIPVGRPVMIRGTSHDVIHSFWAPNLQGKRDLIPSRITTEWIQADRPGQYRGQCAEFCGLQHAHMALWVIAEPQDKFEQWLEAQRQPAAVPADAVKQRGQEVFLNSACVLCHAIGGTTAAGQVGPDLTHFGSRLTIAAGTLPNNRGNLGGWIADPQTIKPGNHMATVPLKPEDIQPLIEYLESLR